MLGRVYALRSPVVSLIFMLSGLGLAYLADRLPVRWIYIGAGFLYLATALYAPASTALRSSRITPEPLLPSTLAPERE